ncbi:MAG: hypothetical protein IPO81_21115 [Kouleothrix sp.]|nr:hypothetical protein [Kouleothrix sp.]
MTQLPPLAVIIVGLLIIVVAFRILRGMIRLAITLAVIGVIIYLVLNVLR